MDYECTEIRFEAPITADSLRDFLLTRARAVLQNGAHAQTLVACFGRRAEIYTIAQNATMAQREEIFDTFKGMVNDAGADRVAVVFPGVICQVDGESELVKKIASGAIPIESLPTAKKMLNMTIQDPLRHWQYVYSVVDLEDGTSYPGDVIVSHEPDSPGDSSFAVPMMFYERGASPLH